jgi:hypothetical protein
MQQNLTLRHIRLGKIDATDELEFAQRADREAFHNSYFVPTALDSGDFISGDRFFILGLKGTGKTAFLRYLDLEMQDQDCRTQFVLFKSQISEAKRKQIGMHNEDDIRIADDARGGEHDKDFEPAWRWFLHRVIAETLSGRDGLESPNDALKQYLAIIRATDPSKERFGIKKLFPKISKGMIDVAKDTETNIELEWADKDETKVRIEDLTDQLDQVFGSLDLGANRYFIFIDELELKLGSKKQFERDARLIRDLIVTVRHLNAISRRTGWNVRIICAVRTEVLQAIGSLGKEVEKATIDFGRLLDWHSAINEETLHPLNMMLCRRIMASEKAAGISSGSEEDVWRRYFRDTNDHLSQKELLHFTWFRPRDLIRLLSVCQTKSPDERTFGKEEIHAAMKTYSSQSWREIASELNVKYRDTELTGLSQALTRFKHHFRLDEFRAELDKKASSDSAVASLRDYAKPGDILRDLYRVGAVGNQDGKGVRFAFRGDQEVDLTGTLMVHRALWSHFGLVQP